MSWQSNKPLQGRYQAGIISVLVGKSTILVSIIVDGITRFIRSCDDLYSLQSSVDMLKSLLSCPQERRELVDFLRPHQVVFSR